MTRPTTRHRDDSYAALACGWALNALEPDDEAGFVPHLAGCPFCAQTVEDTRQTMADLALALPDFSPPPGLRTRLLALTVAETPVRPRQSADPVRLAAVQAPAPAPVPRSHRKHPARRRRQLAVMAALLAALAAAVTALGIQNLTLSDDRADLQRALAQRQATIDRLSTSSPAAAAALGSVDGSGRRLATVLLRDREVDVVADGLPPNDTRTSTYVLWGLRSRGDAAPTALGTFDVTAGGGQVSAVRVDGRSVRYPVLAVTREPGRSLPRLRGRLLAIGDVRH